MLQSIASWRVRHELAAEQQQNKDPELCHVNDLAISLLHPSSLEGRPHPFSPVLRLYLVSVWNNLFVCKLSHLRYCVSNKKNFAPVFTVFASLKNSYFEIEERAREIFASSLYPCWSSGQDFWFSSRLPRFNSWEGNKVFDSNHCSLLPLWYKYNGTRERLIESVDVEPSVQRTTVMQEPSVPKADYKLYSEFWLSGGSVLLTSRLFKGQLSSNFITE